MIAAMLLIFSMVALGQFAVYYWRAMLAGMAAQPLSDQVQRAVGIDKSSLGFNDFEALVNLHELTPGLKGGHANLLAVRLYYRATKALGGLMPQLADWTQREMSTCTQYVAVVIDQRLQRNLSCAAEIRSC
jgi:hypothetical protein